MLREERDPDWWTAIAAHPGVADGVYGMTPEAVGKIAERADIVPLASEHGGFLFARLDVLGFARDMHCIYTPEGWGREVTLALVVALETIFQQAQIVQVFEMATNPNSRPPRSFGFAIAGEFRRTTLGFLRLWVLTQTAWESSPAHRRHICRQ
jgi:hypothetical protein